MTSVSCSWLVNIPTVECCYWGGGGGEIREPGSSYLLNAGRGWGARWGAALQVRVKGASGELHAFLQGLKEGGARGPDQVPSIILKPKHRWRVRTSFIRYK